MSEAKVPIGPEAFRPGQRVLARDATGTLLARFIAPRAYESTHLWDGERRRRIHDFPVVYVADRVGDAGLPWPAEDVVPRD